MKNPFKISLAKKVEPKPERKDLGKQYLYDLLTISRNMRQYYSQGLTPVKLKNYLLLADQGDIYSQMQLFDEMEEKDTHLYSELQKRKMAVTKWPWRVAPSDETDKQAVQIAEETQNLIKAIPDFQDDLLDIMDALGKGISFTEIIWDNSEGQTAPVDLAWIEPWFFDPIDKGQRWKIYTKEKMSAGEELPPYKFITHIMRAKSGSPIRAGLVRICAWMYLFKNYSIKDWVMFLEIYGIPLRIGKYGAGAGDPEKEVLKQAVTGLGSDGAGIISKETEIEIINGISGQASNVHEVMARFCNREMSKAILGTVSSGDRGTGTYAEEKANLEVRADLNEADIKSISSTLRRDLIKPIVLFNFGEDAVKKYLPTFEFVIEEPVDLKAEAEVDRIVIKDLGLPASKKWLRGKYNIPEPEDESDIHSAPETVAAMRRDFDEMFELKKKYEAVPACADRPALRKTLRMQQKSGI